MSRRFTKFVAAVILAAFFIISILPALVEAFWAIAMLVIVLGLIASVFLPLVTSSEVGELHVCLDFQWRYTCYWYLGLGVWPNDLFVSIRGPPRTETKCSTSKSCSSPESTAPFPGRGFRFRKIYENLAFDCFFI
jgi:hypothetical protein